MISSSLLESHLSLMTSASIAPNTQSAFTTRNGSVAWRRETTSPTAPAAPPLQSWYQSTINAWSGDVTDSIRTVCDTQPEQSSTRSINAAKIIQDPDRDS